jgi:hypothetical protein
MINVLRFGLKSHLLSTKSQSQTHPKTTEEQEKREKNTK